MRVISPDVFGMVKAIDVLHEKVQTLENEAERQTHLGDYEAANDAATEAQCLQAKIELLWQRRNMYLDDGDEPDDSVKAMIKELLRETRPHEKQTAEHSSEKITPLEPAAVRRKAGCGSCIIM